MKKLKILFLLAVLWLYRSALTGDAAQAAPAAPSKPTTSTPAEETARPAANPRSLELNEQGVSAVKAKDFRRAEGLFRNALAIDAGNVSAAFNLAGALLANKKEGEAILFLSEYTKNYAEDAGLFVRLGDAYFAAKKPRQAISAYERALQLQPTYPGLSAKLGTVFGLANQPLEAERAFLLAVAQNPKDGQALSNLASIFLANGKPDKAISTAKRALQVKPTAELYITLGTAYEIKRDFKNALIAFQRAVDLGDKREELLRKIDALKQAVS